MSSPAADQGCWRHPSCGSVPVPKPRGTQLCQLRLWQGRAVPTVPLAGDKLGDPRCPEVTSVSMGWTLCQHCPAPWLLPRAAGNLMSPRRSQDVPGSGGGGGNVTPPMLTQCPHVPPARAAGEGSVCAGPGAGWGTETPPGFAQSWNSLLVPQNSKFDFPLGISLARSVVA